MCAQLAVGDEAPDFDLSSTEDALLMLRDEVPRKTIVLYFASDLENDEVREGLKTLARHHGDITEHCARVLAVSAAKMPELKRLQAELRLPFPLLHDHGDFSAAYGVAATQEGESPKPALAVVNRNQRVVLLANPVSSIEQAMTEIKKVLAQQPSPTQIYPKNLINWLVDRWVN